MFIEYDGGQKVCKSHEEVIAILEMRNNNNENEYWISLELKFPCMALLVKNDVSSVHYFPNEDSAGFRALKSDIGLGEAVQITIGGHQYEIESEAIIPVDEVISAVLYFYDNHVQPNNFVWDEL